MPKGGCLSKKQVKIGRTNVGDFSVGYKICAFVCQTDTGSANEKLTFSFHESLSEICSLWADFFLFLPTKAMNEKVIDPIRSWFEAGMNWPDIPRKKRSVGKGLPCVIWSIETYGGVVGSRIHFIFPEAGRRENGE